MTELLTERERERERERESERERDTSAVCACPALGVYRAETVMSLRTAGAQHEEVSLFISGRREEMSLSSWITGKPC